MKKDLPKYAARPLRRFLDHSDDCHRLLALSMQGVSGLRALPGLIQALGPFEKDAPEGDPLKRRVSLEDARLNAEFAQKECEAGFPLLHAQTLVGEWGALEAAVEDMLVGILSEEPGTLQGEAFSKVRIPLAQFETLEKEERMRLLIGEIERSNGSRKQGTDKFEALLGPFGISGKVEPEAEKAIREMHHVRNVIVHRGGLADRRLIEGCPWMGLKIGDPVIVTNERLGQYCSALCGYVLSIVHCLGERYGVDIASEDKGEYHRHSSRR